MEYKEGVDCYDPLKASRDAVSEAHLERAAEMNLTSEEKARRFAEDMPVHLGKIIERLEATND